MGPESSLTQAGQSVAGDRSVAGETTLAAAGLAIGFRQRREVTRLAEGLSCKLRGGQLICLLGPNGVGKSTLIRTLGGLLPPLAGQVLLDGQEISRLTPMARARRLGLVLTEPPPAVRMTARELVALGRYPHTGWSGRLTRRDHAAVARALDAVGAAGLAGRPLSEVSDGERQRLYIARALAQEAEILLLDEPTAFLDLPRRVEMMALLGRLAGSGRAVLVSTHDLGLAMRTADVLWLLRRSGELVVGSPESLAMAGAIERSFPHQGMVFDPREAAFRPSGSGARIRLQGDGARGLWTRRTLERLGYEVVDEGEAEARVVVSASEPPKWQLEAPQGRSEHKDLDSLAAAVGRAP